jgi:hypothetical protein
LFISSDADENDYSFITATRFQQQLDSLTTHANINTAMK